ncbi:ActS/PrrB/RegB family redox-sensitive histidine kinase [Alphaproteobacteria bacterium]|nr:ActS/PrrB/RegB family redox-sensitive histidine kinase [Alphaproteobacteria bacterium]
MKTVLLANLIKIRWIAIVGQLITLFTIFFVFNFTIPLTECLFVVLLSILVNFSSYFIQKGNSTLTDKKTFLFLLFDISQLVGLLFLTGGVFNPFVILILAPIIISASYLSALSTILLSLYSILLILIINFNYIPLNWEQNFIIPSIYNIGILVALIITIIFLALYAYLFASSARKISSALTATKLKLSNQKKTTEVAYLSAAAVHELSTPLNTIFLVLNDLLKEKVLISNSVLIKDIELLKSQAERCKEILLSLSKNPQNLKDNFFEKIRIIDLIKLNFEKFNDSKKLIFNFDNFNKESKIYFKDEVNYALGNIIQNAILYSKLEIKIFVKINKKDFTIKIEDDGGGFSRDVLDKLGEPYISKNKKGMGLGIFIAKNLIENMKGNIIFYNSNNSGAVVEIKFDKTILI